ncbi:hypothetical protein HY493_00290 [Candidatus Woesearchaeota archaeon]|nr:hypothetical protein [Candidatus Woesearchaeota archaeon]
MKIKICYEPLETKTPEEQQILLTGLAGSLAQTGSAPQTYVTALKTLLGCYGVILDARERLIQQPVIHGEVDEAQFGRLEQELLKLPGVTVAKQNEYKGF